MEALPYIVITGCGSSGTKFAARAWQTVGVNVGHEKPGVQGVSSWYVAPGAGAAFLNARGVRLPPFGAIPWEGVEKRAIGRGIVCFHQVRQPIKVISTVQRYSTPSWQYIVRTLQRRGVAIKESDPLIHRCMLYWYHWNLMAEELAEYRYRVEDFAEEWRAVCARAGREDKIQMLPKIQGIPKTVNSRKRKYKPLEWGQLQDTDAELTEKIKKLGRRYGYQIR